MPPTQECSLLIAAYFAEIDAKVEQAYDVAGRARAKGLDPEERVDIPLARNMAERVEGLISAVAPQINGSGISRRIGELEKEYGSLDWRVALAIAKEIAREKFCTFASQKEAMEIGIRVGFAYLTMGTVASPLEGFVEIRLRKRKDGREYFAINFAGPVRSAGGTAAAVAVLMIDYIRKEFGFAAYDPTDQEIRRYATELYDYHERVNNLQYLPSEEEIRFLAEHLPLQLDGDPSEELEVSNYKDLARVDTNRIRSGVCLVMGEAVAQKAQKVWSRMSKWMKEFGLEHWVFLEEFIRLQKSIKAKKTGVSAGKEGAKQKITPVYTYIADLVAGRPVLSHPLANGGFRLRYGRCRVSGYSSAGLNPAAMVVLNEYIGIGTQLKVERPGKAATISACDTIDGPIVRLKDGTVLQLDSEEEARKAAKEVAEILYLGDILFNYGDFYNRAHPLVPAGYCPEWWALEMKKEGDSATLALLSNCPEEEVRKAMEDPLHTRPKAAAAIALARATKTPLHPAYTYFWNTLKRSELARLLASLPKVKIISEEGKILRATLPNDKDLKRILELLGIPHTVVANEYLVLGKSTARAFCATLGIDRQSTESIQQLAQQHENEDTLSLLQVLSGMLIRDKAGTFIGARMGRPEKAKMRKLTGSPHMLFPVGSEGGKMRSMQSALQKGKITAQFSRQWLEKLKARYGEVFTLQDESADAAYVTAEINLTRYFPKVLEGLHLLAYPDLIKGVIGTSNREHIPEDLMKGILRAKHDVYVNKDGTTRYDMTQLAITHFTPKEIGTPIPTLRNMGYTTDAHGNPLESSDQILELKPQDIILPACAESQDEGADKALFKTAQFIDDLLLNFYGLPPYFNAAGPQDIIGHLVLALAPHTSAGIIARIIGFSKTQGFYAHPVVHAATRRDCDGDEASVTLLIDALLNFSRKFLPKNRGSTQDAPLVTTSRLIPAEVDDMVFDLDVAWEYPLKLYEAALEYMPAHEVEIDQIGKRLHTPRQYEGMGYTHETASMNAGVRISAYKTLPSMQEKLMGQMDLAEKIRAVDEADVARLVIEKHFIRDIRGNLRKFSQQQFRCVACNTKFRRPPLVGKCLSCGGKIVFTISEGSIVKSLEPPISLATKYHLPAYLQQSIDLTRRRVEAVFGRDKEKQEGLGRWFG